MTELLWTLILIQIVMGLFDTVYHHELTERLAWRASQQHELALHAVRNLPLRRGVRADRLVRDPWRVGADTTAILATEVIITLIDFVEEDLSR